uniref:Uncharacterized protein n=1 Tax=Arion vulgaris TaxID=1028688 RepID=A0A0B6Y397_9EUPU
MPMLKSDLTSAWCRENKEEDIKIKGRTRFPTKNYIEEYCARSQPSLDNFISL